MGKTYTAIVIDDNPYLLKDFEALVKTHPLLSCIRVVGYFKSCRAALRFLKRYGEVDLVFCDIILPGENGLHLADSFFDYTSFFLIISSFGNYKEMALDVGVDGYIMKPIDPGEVRKKVNRLERLRQSGRMIDDVEKKIFLNDADRHQEVKVPLRDIVVAEVHPSRLNYLSIRLTHQTLTVKKSLTSLKRDLMKTDFFVQLHQSAIVSKLHVAKVLDGGVHMDNDFFYPVSSRHKKVLTELANYLATIN